jgi:hypothetical protein
MKSCSISKLAGGFYPVRKSFVIVRFAVKKVM